MPVTMFAEFAPDQGPLSQAARFVQNVLPLTPGSYGPVYELEERGNSLSNYCQGAGAFRGLTDGTAVNFAGDLTDLYLWDGTAWNSVTRSAGGNYATPTDGGWRFEQFRNAVVAVNGVDENQFWSIGTSTNFAQINSTSASTDASPIARYARTVRDFMFLGYLSTDRAAVRWSEQFNYKSYRTGTNQSDSQELPNYGSVTGIEGSQYAIVFQQNGINLFSYVGVDSNGQGLVFQRDTVSDELGCIAPGSLSTAGQTSFFLSSRGFNRIDGGQAISSIGQQRVDDYFNGKVNKSFLYRITSAIDYENKLYYIAAPSTLSSTGDPDFIMAYNFGIDRWAELDFGVDVLWNMYASLGVTLEGLDAIYPDLDAMAPSLDSEIFQSTPQKTLATFKSTKKLAFFEGDALDAIIDSVEAETNPFRQAEIDRIIPYIDGGTISCLLGRRDRLNDAITFSAQSDQDRFGDIKFREPPARFHRARVLWTPGTGTHAQGIEFMPADGGDR